MAETATPQPTEKESGTQTSPEQFTPVEIERFEQEDATAGRAIGKMLAIFFLYTVVFTGLVATWFTISAMRGE